MELIPVSWLSERMWH